MIAITSVSERPVTDPGGTIGALARANFAALCGASIRAGSDCGVSRVLMVSPGGYS